MKLNRKGFTLVEVLAAIVIIALLGGIAIPNILSTINTSKNKSEEILIENIKTASQELCDEVEFNGEINKKGDIIESNLEDPIIGANIKMLISKKKDKENNESCEINDESCKIINKSITVSLQALVSNGFLQGTGKEDGKEDGEKIIKSPKNGENIGTCQIKITKTIDSSTYETTYKVEKKGTNSVCPDYN